MITTRPKRPQRRAPTLYGYFAARIMLAAVIVLVTATACTPRVAVEAPKEPIVINMNVKIEHEVRVKVDKELDDLFNENPELF